jgi:hypothetical protein
MNTQPISFIPRLSKTSKMPSHSFSLPAQECITGAKLAKIEGSVCHGCYALKGFYHMPPVKQPRYDNLSYINHPQWVDTMVKHISKTSLKNGFFRWHDSGDLQSLTHLKNIVSIARALPTIKFWLPTKEANFLKAYASEGLTLPPNISIRLSMPMIDQAPNLPQSIYNLGVNTSTVHKSTEGYGTVCPAYTNAGKCGDCRQCWDTSIDNISYPIH